MHSCCSAAGSVGDADVRGFIGVWLMRNVMIVGAVVLAIGLAVFFLPDLLKRPTPATARIEMAEAICISNPGITRSADVDAKIAAATEVSARAAITSAREIRRGAAKDLPAEVQVAENTRLRACMMKLLGNDFKP